MFLLNNSVQLNKYSVILCDDKQILETLTYQQMINYSETVENELAKSINEKNICLGLLMDHNLYIPSIILSLQKLKCAFIFLTSRNLAKILSYLKLQWILSFEEINEIPLFCKVNRLRFKNKYLILWKNCEQFYTNLNLENIFCVVQTSGSTGENKLIRVTKICIESNASNLRKVFDLKSEDVIFWGTSLTFDPTIIELIVALQCGACLAIVPYKIYINPKSLYEVLFSIANITFLQMVPSVFLRWNKDQIKQVLLNSQLKILALGGEHFPKRVLCYERRKHLRIFNLYGISEVSCWATLHEITNETHNDEIPIGQALDATLLELRDEYGVKTSCGAGEIFIGSCSRICYVNEESSTDTPGTVFRETGDIAEVRENKIFLVGRKNKIIKRFGHRINLTKLENKIFQQTGLENICIWSQKNTKLLTFILMKDLDLSIKRKILDKLRVKLINILPDESFPDFIEIVTHFPLTSHGKINEKSLEKLYSISEMTDNYENTFSLLWCRYVGIPSEHLTELKHYKFFDLGGNSIRAIQLLTEFKQITKCDYPPELVTMTFESSFTDCMDYLKGIRPLKKKSNDNVLEECATKKTKINEGGLKVLWSYDLKACVDSSPLGFEIENKIYIAVGSFSHRFIVFQDDGQVFYEITLPDSIESTPRLSPCRKFILIGCFNGVMYCMDFVKRKVVWEFATNSKIKSSACFCREGTAAVFGSYDKTIYCVSIMEGLKLWNILLDGSISSSPIFSDTKKSVYVATTKGTCFSLKETGQIFWKKSCGGPVFGTPCLIRSDENIILPTVQGILHCLQTINGELLWKYQADGHIFSSVVSCEDQIVFGCFDRCINILNISGSNCVLVKKVKVMSEISSTPFICSANGNHVIVGACNSGVISVIDFGTFELLSSIQLPAEIFSSPFVYDEKIYVGCRDNNFYCIQLNK